MHKPHADLVQPVAFTERNAIELGLADFDEGFNELVHQPVMSRTEPARLLYRSRLPRVELERQREYVIGFSNAFTLSANRARTTWAGIKPSRAAAVHKWRRLRRLS
ncbi:hypothetical protein ACVIGA_000642 [Bradyrhizobium sp. USDA 3240]